MNARIATDIFHAALAAVDPYNAVRQALNIQGDALIAGGASYVLSGFSRIVVIGAGKATARMAQAVEDILGDRISDGLIIVKYGHTAAFRTIRQIEAGHPIPDEAGASGTRKVIETLNGADEKTLVICLISGGGSALLVSPFEGITLKDKQGVTELLLKSGATIVELNAVRKHLSSVKGGGLSRIAQPAAVITLILSDVIGDRLDVIASGPTAPDSSTFRDAWSVIEKYNLTEKIPDKVCGRLERGVAGDEPETPKAGDACFAKTSNVIVGGLRHAVSAAVEKAGEMGFDAEVVTTELQGEARDAASYLADIAWKAKDALKRGGSKCLISGGETTVSVRGHGIGGRNQELALAFAIKIAGLEGITMLSAGTDGTDGPTDAAGAVVDRFIVKKARECGLDPSAYLENNDSYTFFRKFDALTGAQAHLKTGPTGTNVMDMQIVLISRD